jgi:catechol 2,3-dioxygenase-like lactoylglutathione lyase family enzyme
MPTTAPPARFKDLCMDAADPEVLGRFWAGVLGLRLEGRDGGVVLRGDAPQLTVWVDRVPEPKTVKHRVHLDVVTSDRELLSAAGAVEVLPAEQSGHHWSVHADPEGGEFCSFLRPDRPADPPAALYELVIDTADATSSHELAEWWGWLLGGRVVDDERGFSYVDRLPDTPIDSLDMIPVPEPKTVKNRVHLDVICDDVDVLLARGARVLAEPTATTAWHVMADPQGNEFCIYTPASRE